MLRSRRFPILLTTIAAFCGCDEGKRIPAVGPGSEVVVLASGKSTDLGDRVAEVLATETLLVRPEPAFTVERDDLGDAWFYRTRKLLFVVGRPDDPGFEKFLKRSTGTTMESPLPGLTIIVDPFSAGQILFVLSGKRPEIRRALDEDPRALLDVVEESAVTLMLTNMFRAGEVPQARNEMLERWGIGVRTPPEWVIDDRFAERNFVRVWRDAPVEQIFLSWEPGRVERTGEEWLRHRHELVWKFYEEDEVVFDRSEFEDGAEPFKKKGTRLRGLWENDKYVIGGPFESWAFYCREDDRTYFVDLCVYAPDRPKLPLIRHLRAVSRTLRCGCVPPSPRGSAS